MAAERETDRPDLPGTAHPAPASLTTVSPATVSPAAGAAAGWDRLRPHTPARIGLARSGPAVATSAHLAFQLAHARARDAVHDPLDRDRLAGDLEPALAPRGLGLLAAESRAGERATYLTRPDLGRRLSEEAEARLAAAAPADGADAALVVVDGLSARAVQVQVPPLLTALLERLDAADPPWRLAPTVIVAEGRVAVGDAVAAALGAAMAVVLNRRAWPGLSGRRHALGVYLTVRPRPAGTTIGRTQTAAPPTSGREGRPRPSRRVAWPGLMSGARRRGTSGIGLRRLPDRQALPAAAISADRGGSAGDDVIQLPRYVTKPKVASGYPLAGGTGRRPLGRPRGIREGFGCRMLGLTAARRTQTAGARAPVGRVAVVPTDRHRFRRRLRMSR